jgi:hypothetical protein
MAQSNSVFSKSKSKTSLLFLVLILAFNFSCSSKKTDGGEPAPDPEAGFLRIKPEIKRFNESLKNSDTAQRAPYVVMVSLDGFRHDYEKMYGAKTLEAIAKNGVQAAGLIPIYPSKTFPNHYSIVTGLYADEHGLVSNEFLDPQYETGYSIGSNSVSEGKWYGGEPVWVTAQKNEMLTASFFWIGSEALIQGASPNWYAVYNGKVPNSDRVNQVISWLQLPEAERPHFITLYFSVVDDAGHAMGPESEEVRTSVQQVDELLEKLRTGIAETRLPVNLIVVSDHGMEKLDQTKTILIDESIDLTSYNVSGQGTMMKLHLKPGFPKSSIDQTVTALKTKKGPYRVWKRSEMKKFNYSKSPRSGDIIIEPDAPYLVYTKAPSSGIRGGNHGWDPQRFRSMHGIFYAEGPAFKSGVKLPAFENIHVQPLITHILGLKNAPKVSGNLDVTKGALVK